MPSFRLLAPALFALALLSAPPSASAQSFSDIQRGDIESIVRNYLIAHPEVLEEAMAELSKRQSAAEAEKHAASVAQQIATRIRVIEQPSGPRMPSLGAAAMATRIQERSTAVQAY